METQGSSLSSLQSTLMSLASNAGKPHEARKSPIQAAMEGNKQFEDKRRDAALQEQLLHLSRQLQEEMKRVNTNIDFSYNEEIKGLVVTVRDATGERIIREIPSKEAIELMRKMRDLIGNIFDERV
ncbi:flagellar protein FlaG [Helicobacter sp. MIT 14-3879]|uniref:flagellar protein FlaG n=1 Tax=Helicobacter sp. MIT 14-3879 TaxID=2040649 RepID=UPI000E1F9697|nr:flagellar protein FlaG [Helicobacter sp. MIT 14-3879]RDU60912.1 flagellin protein [Helicobacter sp. MIT 14-3879]